MIQTLRAMSWATAAVAAALGVPSLASADEPQAAFHALAVNMSNVGPTGAVPIDITIERWTTEEERTTLRTALAEKGKDSLMDALRKLKRAGSIRASSGGLGWDVQYARKHDLPSGGYRVVVATDRPMSFYERLNHPITADYEYLVAEMHIGPDGKGQGTLVPMAKVEYDKSEGVIEIENYASEPVRLTEVRDMASKEDKAKASTKDDKAKRDSAKPDKK
jgi:hypothetical protein